jgi:hypothetical protein
MRITVSAGRKSGARETHQARGEDAAHALLIGAAQAVEALRARRRSAGAVKWAPGSWQRLSFRPAVSGAASHRHEVHATRVLDADVSCLLGSNASQVAPKRSVA